MMRPQALRLQHMTELPMRRTFSALHARRVQAPHPNEDIISQLASQPQKPLNLRDLVRYGWPPLSDEALIDSANNALQLIPIRLAHRIQALRSLPFIVVSNPHIEKIYETYMASFQRLYMSTPSEIADAAAEKEFTTSLSRLVEAHTDTIPVLARGFQESSRYLQPGAATKFLDSHLRARIGTRLIAEQHLALHDTTFNPPKLDRPDPYVGIINTKLRPAQLVEMSAGFVGDICELRYGQRPEIEIDGDKSMTFAYIPMHLDYILTELLKNAFRATIENNPNEPIHITIVPEPSDEKLEPGDPAPGVTIRIRDRGHGIPAAVLPDIWSYSFTTMDGAKGQEDDDDSTMYYTHGGLAAIQDPGIGGSSLAGLGYGLPLSRAYAEYFGGGIQVESLFGWGTDVFLRLQGLGKAVVGRPK